VDLMMRNIEIKVHCPDLDVVRRRARVLGASYEWTHRDTDTYFRVQYGRLKLRETHGSPTGTLITYQRPDETESRISRYQLVTINEVDALRRMLAETLGILTTVVKTRELFMYENTRIHLDTVEGLGTFVELETVIRDQTEADARAEHSHVLFALGLEEFEVVPISYSDLMIG
jgi:adenylate cyclase, class 2